MSCGLAACIALGIAAGAIAQSAGPAPNARASRTREFLGLGPAPDPVAAERGEKLYMPNCAFCHGAKANGGDTGPDLVRSALVLHDEKGELIGPVVTKGRPDRGMPAFSNFNEGQISDLAAFLHMRIELAANRGLYKVQNVVTGDAKSGEAYFNGAGRCSTCHSPSCDLAHVAAKFGPADLQAQLLYPGASARFDGEARPPAAPKVTVMLPSGKIVTGSLKRLDDFNVSMYDSSGEYHSWPRSEVKVEVEDRLVAHRQLLDQYSDADVHNLLAYLETLK
jgi:cytochrome c oxidase cbb3-type subunit 3